MLGKAIRLIVGLCNPGNQYSNTRHNVGAWYVEKLVNDNSLKLNASSKFNGILVDFVTPDGKVFLLLPTTYMNNSGRAVAAVANYYKILPEEILVAHDDLDIECGSVKIKLAGGHGGHNGLKDIDKSLSSKNYYRLRIGISHPGDRSLVSDYVLSAPSKAEESKIISAIDEAVHITPDILKGNIEMVTKYLHTKKGE